MVSGSDDWLFDRAGVDRTRSYPGQVDEFVHVVLGQGHAVADLIGSGRVLDTVRVLGRQLSIDGSAGGYTADLADALEEFVAAWHVAVPVIAVRAEQLSDTVHEAMISYRDDDQAAQQAFEDLSKRFEL